MSKPKTRSRTPRIRCTCTPHVVGTWREEELVSLDREHTASCGLPAEPVDPDTWRPSRAHTGGQNPTV